MNMRMPCVSDLPNPWTDDDYFDDEEYCGQDPDEWYDEQRDREDN
jgi:hypothetical protein